MPPFPAHYASFFLCCVCISLDINASFEGGYTAFLPPSPSSIVTCHPRFIVVKCLRYDAPPLRPLSNGQISHCDNIVPQQLIVVLCLPPHSKTFQMFTAHPRPVNPSMLCPCAPSNNIHIHIGVSSSKVRSNSSSSGSGHSTLDIYAKHEIM